MPKSFILPFRLLKTRPHYGKTKVTPMPRGVKWTLWSLTIFSLIGMMIWFLATAP